MHRLSVPAGLVLLALAGCMRGDDPGEATPPPPGTGSPAPMPAPAPAGDAGAGEWTVTARGAGPATVGLPLARAASALGAAPDTAAARGGCGYLRPAGGPAGVKVMVNEGTVARVEVDSGTVRTAEGAGIGDPAARVRELYAGRVAEAPHKYVPAGRGPPRKPRPALDSNPVSAATSSSGPP